MKPFLMPVLILVLHYAETLNHREEGMHRMQADVEREAAWITLFVLRTLMGDEGAVLIPVVADHPTRTGEAEVMSHLVDMQKPVYCNAHSTTGQLVVRCEPLPVEKIGVLQFRSEMRAMHGGILGTASVDDLSKRPSPRVLIRNTMSGMFASPDAVDFWDGAYVVADDVEHTLSSRPPAETERAAGVDWVVDIGLLTRAKGFTDVPEATRAILEDALARLKRMKRPNR